jgi:hypothetical protein
MPSLRLLVVTLTMLIFSLLGAVSARVEAKVASRPVCYVPQLSVVKGSTGSQDTFKFEGSFYCTPSPKSKLSGRQLTVSIEYTEDGETWQTTEGVVSACVTGGRIKLSDTIVLPDGVFSANARVVATGRLYVGDKTCTNDSFSFTKSAFR